MKGIRNIFKKKKFDLDSEMKVILDRLEAEYSKKCANCDASKDGCKSMKIEMVGDIVKFLSKYFVNELYSLFRIKEMSREQSAAELFFARGVSMYPAIEEGDLIINSMPVKLSIGDIISFYYPVSRGVIIHRIVGEDDDFYYTSGDNCQGKTEKVRKMDVIGVVSQVIKKLKNPELYELLTSAVYRGTDNKTKYL